MKIFSSNDPSKQDEPSITLQREEVTQVQAPVRHPWDTTQRKMMGNNDPFFSPTTIPWLHHSVDFWGVHLGLHLLMIFFVNDNFFSKYLKIDMTSLRLHSGYPLKETKWRLVQEIDQEIDTALGWATYKSIFLVKTALLVVVRITYPWPVGKNHKDTDLYPKISGGVLACLQ